MLDKIYQVYKTVNLRNRQRKINRDFEKDGLTANILKEQIAINQERNELNIVDENEIISETFVQ